MSPLFLLVSVGLTMYLYCKENSNVSHPWKKRRNIKTQTNFVSFQMQSKPVASLVFLLQRPQDQCNVRVYHVFVSKCVQEYNHDMQEYQYCYNDILSSTMHFILNWLWFRFSFLRYFRTSV